MASEVYCDVCDRRGSTSIASKFCTDCEDKLCAECCDVHRSLKPCVNHHVVDVTVVTDQSFTVNKICEKHADLTFELYCCDHDVICCRSCMADEHRKCTKLIPVEVASKNVKSSTMFEDVSKHADHLKNTAKRMTDGANKSRSLLSESKMASIDKVSEIKEKLYKRIAELASRCVSDINTIYSEHLGKVDKDDKLVADRVRVIQTIIRKFEHVTKHGSEMEIFLLLNSLKNDIYNVDVDLQKFLSSLKTASIEFEASDEMAILKGLGSIRLKEETFKCVYEHVNKHQAQINVKSNTSLTRFELEKRVNLSYGKSCSVTGMLILKNDRIILCNASYYVKEVLLLKCMYQGGVIQTVKLKDPPWNIAIEADRDYAWVTLPTASYLQIIDTTTMSLKRKVRVSKGYFGIAFVGNDIALGAHGKVDIINKKGGILKSIQVGKSSIYSLCYTGQNQIYCCEPNDSTFHCISFDGISVFSYRSDDFKGPAGVSADSHGNVYVVCQMSNNLHKITGDGKHIDITIPKNNGLNIPKAVFSTKPFLICSLPMPRERFSSFLANKNVSIMSVEAKYISHFIVFLTFVISLKVRFTD